MNILLIGGTAFLGRHIAAHAISRHHALTLFNRGLRNPTLFPEARHLRGDRNESLAALAGMKFDAVIDTCGYTPAQMRKAAAALGDDVPQYLFISSISAYSARPPRVAYDENTPLLVGDAGYGEEKARAEEAIRAAYQDRVTIVRPGLIVGPHDPTGRFAYWPQRFASSIHRRVLAPGRPLRPVQWIDVRDLAEWIVHCVEHGTQGQYNAITPHDAHTMQDLLSACAANASQESFTHWIDDATLLEENVAPWTELPLWIPENDADAGGLMLARADRAVAAGLRFRSVSTTVYDTLEWLNTLPVDAGARGLAKTLKPDRESELLRKYVLNDASQQ